MKRMYTIGLLLLCGACSLPNLDNVSNIGKESDPTRFYTLTATAKQEKPLRNSPVIVVDPVDIASYLDRSHIVVRETETKLELGEFDRWASSPASEIRRVLVQDLAAQLRSQSILLNDNDNKADYRVRVRVERFDYTESGEALLEVAWQVDHHDGRTSAIRRQTYTESSDKSYDKMTLAFSHLVEKMSADIAAICNR